MSLKRKPMTLFLFMVASTRTAVTLTIASVPNQLPRLTRVAEELWPLFSVGLMRSLCILDELRMPSKISAPIAIGANCLSEVSRE